MCLSVDVDAVSNLTYTVFNIIFTLSLITVDSISFLIKSDTYTSSYKIVN